MLAKKRFRTPRMAIVSSMDEGPYALDALSEKLEGTHGSVALERGAHDAMFDTAEHYVEVGRSALRAIRLALLSAERRGVHRVLDFACGHGRVLRQLVAAFPEAEFFACDIDEDGVRYCAEHFGATPIVSTPEMSDVELPTNCDLIWVGSLLTHLDQAGWQRFITRVLPSMARGGVLVFTSHGRHVERRIRAGESYLLERADAAGMCAEYASNGFSYRDYADTPGYGVPLSSLPWILERIAELEALRIVYCAEGAWDGHQDVVACERV